MTKKKIDSMSCHKKWLKKMVYKNYTYILRISIAIRCDVSKKNFFFYDHPYHYINYTIMICMYTYIQRYCSVIN